MTAALRTIFMGTPEIAVPAMHVLARRTQLQLVVTQPDRPAGRGLNARASAVKVAAEALGLPVWQPETLKNAEAAPQLQGADLFVVMAYGEILRQAVLDLPHFGCVNLHASLLPRWRGASPLQAAIRAGDDRSGVTVMQMVKELDAGPIYLSEEIFMNPRITLPELHEGLSDTAAVALTRFLDQWPKVHVHRQDDAKATYCKKLTKEDGRLDFSKTVTEIDRWIRAYTPTPGCWALAGAERLFIRSAHPHPLAGPLEPGQVKVENGDLVVGCRDGAMVITSLQAPGKREMTAAEFLRGNQPPAKLG